MSAEIAEGIRATAQRLGIDPVDLATVVSYETSGKFDPQIKGPRTQWGQHQGLIQMGDTQRARYGIKADSPLPDQFNAIERYLRDAGVKEGHGLLDLYAAVNGGRVGRYNVTDENNGGAPGTVADKVRSMAAHRVRAQALLGQPVSDATSGVVPGVPVAASPAPAGASAAPMGIAPPVDVAGDDAAFQGMLETLKRTLAAHEEESMAAPLPALKIHFPETALRRSMAARKV